VLADCTSATMKGVESSVVMNQPAASSCIQLPMFETSDAPHSRLKLRCRNGLQAEAGNPYSPCSTKTR
jgi:hypothetical protein